MPGPEGGSAVPAVQAHALDFRRAFEAGRSTWGDVGLAFEAFAEGAHARIRARLERLGLPVTPESIQASIRAAAGADLYLARAGESGSEEAWQTLHAAFRPRLRALALRRGADGATAEQLAGEVIGQLAEPPPRGEARTVLGTFTGAGSLFGWLAVILVRRLAAGARRRSPVSLAEEEATVPGTRRSADPVAAITDTEAGTRLREALALGWDACTERERLVLLYKYRDGLAQRKVAHLLAIGEPRVSRLVGQAVGRISSAVRGRLEAWSDGGDFDWSVLRDAMADSLATIGAGVPPPHGDSR